MLALFCKQIDTYNSQSHSFSRIKTLWSLQSNQPVTVANNELNMKNKALSIVSYGFSTLYTNIPQVKLKNVIRELTNFWFKSGKNSFLL